MERFVIRILVNGVALFVAERLLDGISYEGDWGGLLIVALIFAIVNAAIRPILKLLTCPLILATLGLFTLIINAAMLLLTSSAARSLGIAFFVDGLVPAILGSIVISIVSVVLSIFVGSDREDDRRRRR